MKKSIVISLLTVMTLFCTAIYSFASTGIVTTDTLRVRKEPSTESSILGLISIDDEVEIIGEEENGWYKIKYENGTGYVAAQYINVRAQANQNNTNTSLNEGTNEEPGETPNQTAEPTNTPKPTNAEENNKKTVKAISANEKIYITPVINALVIETVTEDKQIEIVSEIKGWTYIKIGTTTGWVRTENIKEKEEPQNNNSSQKVGYITTSSVNFRKTPSTSGEIITKLPRNAKVTIINKGEGWSEVTYKGDTGYVSNDYISDKSLSQTTRSSISRTVTNSSNENKASNEETSKVEKTVSTGTVTGGDVVEFAKKFLGYRYTSRWKHTK